MFGSRIAFMFTLLAGSAAYAAPVPSDVLINFGKEDPIDGSGVAGGKYWGVEYYNTAGMASDNTVSAAVRKLKSRTNVLTDLSMQMPNLGGWSNPQRGNGASFTYDGFTFFGNPGTTTPNYNNPMQSYVADNIGTATSTRDGLTVFRFLSAEQYNYRFTIAASSHADNADGDPPAAGIADNTIDSVFNIGGTYSMTRVSPQNGSFTGGTTVHVDPSGDGTYDRGGAVLAGQSIWNATLNAYVIELQMGVGPKGNMAAINALRIQTSAIPEPATLGLALGTAIVLSLRRRPRARAR